MTTVRLEIVNAIASALATATGLRVYRNLDFALEDQHLPVLVLRSGEDSPEGRAVMPMLDQVADLQISVVVARTADPEGACDPYEALAHKALTGTTTFGGNSVSMDRVSGGWDFDLGDCAARHLIYRFGFRTSFTDLEM